MFDGLRGELLRVRRVAGSGRVDEAQQAFAALWSGFARATILRAHVHRGRLRQAAALEDVGEFAGVVGAEEHVVPVEFDTARGRVDGPGDGRERARWRAAWHGAAHAFAQQAVAQRCGVAVEDHAVGLQRFAAGQGDAAHAASVHVDAFAGAAVAKGGTALARQPLQAARQRVHATVDAPHAIELHLRNQHERGRRLPGR